MKFTLLSADFVIYVVILNRSLLTLVAHLRGSFDEVSDFDDALDFLFYAARVVYSVVGHGG